MKYLILRSTRRIWNTEISRLLCNSYNKGIISSNQLHELTSLFDPTQNRKEGIMNKDTVRYRIEQEWLFYTAGQPISETIWNTSLILLWIK